MRKILRPDLDYKENEMQKTIIQFFESLLKIFAVIILIFTISTALLGEEVKMFSNLFLLGNDGLAIKTVFQLLAFAFLICFSRFVFLTDMIFKNAGLILRYIFFFLSTILIFIAFSLIFRWFPNNPFYWFLVLASYSVCTIISIFVTNLFAKKEDEKLNDALAKMKGRIGE